MRKFVIKCAGPPVLFIPSYPYRERTTLVKLTVEECDTFMWRRADETPSSFELRGICNNFFAAIACRPRYEV